MLTFSRYLQYGDHDIRHAAEYAEPGYANPDKGILFANWNPRTFDNPSKADRVMPRIAELAERYGYAIEWEDEWAICDDCHRAVRTSADSYGWKPYYWYCDGGVQCGDCAKENPEEYLEYLKGNPASANCFLNLASLGYEQYNGEFENGFHPGQTDDPGAIARKLEILGHNDYVFQINDNSQFYTTFTVWLPK